MVLTVKGLIRDNSSINVTSTPDAEQQAKYGKVPDWEASHNGDGYIGDMSLTTSASARDSSTCTSREKDNSAAVNSRVSIKNRGYAAMAAGKGFADVPFIVERDTLVVAKQSLTWFHLIINSVKRENRRDVLSLSQMRAVIAIKMCKLNLQFVTMTLRGRGARRSA